MAKKKYADKCCENCGSLISIGEGDHICEENPANMVLENYTPGNDYFWCGGTKWTKK